MQKKQQKNKQTNKIRSSDSNVRLKCYHTCDNKNRMMFNMHKLSSILN